MKSKAQQRRRHHAILVLAVVAAMPIATPAADDVWTNASGGTFSTSSNWRNGLIPGSGDFAHFQVVSSGAGPTYTVNFASSPTNLGTYVHSDRVTFNLGGLTYTQSG